MPVTYQIDANTKTVRTTCIGPVMLEDVIEHFHTLQQDPSCPSHLDVLLDVSGITSLPEKHELRTVTRTIAEISGRVTFGDCAIVASRDAVFGMMRMFEVFAQQYFRLTRVFRTVSEAEAWLAQQQLQANPHS